MFFFEKMAGAVEETRNFLRDRLFHGKNTAFDKMSAALRFAERRGFTAAAISFVDREAAAVK